MTEQQLHQLGVADAANAIADRRTTAAALVDALLKRINTIEPSLGAWVSIDEAEVRESAERSDSVPKSQRGSLHGVPLGIKDIIDLVGKPTGGGFVPFQTRVAGADATIVTKLRSAGALILGKTVTTQFAYMDPPSTRNPWNRDRTPGGSSSGSGASVAAQMVPGAIGSQTGGSILRPAAYNGVVGMKPTFGRVSRKGILPLAWSIDHPGPIARSVIDVAMLLSVIAGHDPLDPSTSNVGVDDYVKAADTFKSPRLLVLDDFVERADVETRTQFANTLRRLGSEGADVAYGRFPGGAACLIAVHSVIMLSEAATVHRRLEQAHGEHYAPRVRAYVQTGSLIPATDYLDAQRLRGQFRAEANQLLRGFDALVLPTALSAAPAADTTGDSSFQSPFSLLGLPSLSLPSGLTTDGLPLGLQFVSAAFMESRLVSAASWSERVLGSLVSPPTYS